MPQEYQIKTLTELRPVMAKIYEVVKSALAKGISVSIILDRLDDLRSLPQNSKMWPMLNDISTQVVWHGMNLSTDDWKDLLGHEWASGKVRFVPTISGNSFYPLGVRTSKLRKRQMAELIEVLYAFGSSYGVVWSEKALACYELYKEYNK